MGSDVGILVGTTAVNNGSGDMGTNVCWAGSLVNVGDGIIVSSSLVVGEVTKISVWVGEVVMAEIVEGVDFTGSVVWDSNWQEIMLRVVIVIANLMKSLVTGIEDPSIIDNCTAKSNATAMELGTNLASSQSMPPE